MSGKKTWPPCDVCGKPVTDPRRAALSLNTEASYQVAKAMRQEEAQYEAEADAGHFHLLTAEELLAGPTAPPWLWSHDRCRPPHQDYEISGERFVTTADALDWTLHLSEKNWWEAMSWASAVRRFFKDLNA